MALLAHRTRWWLWLSSALVVGAVIAGLVNLRLTVPGPVPKVSPAVKISPLGTWPSVKGAYEFAPVYVGHGVSQAGVMAPVGSWRFAVPMRAIDAPGGLFLQVVLRRESDGSDGDRRRVLVRESHALEWYQMPAGVVAASGGVFEIEISVEQGQVGHLVLGAAPGDLIPTADLLLNGEPGEGIPSDLRVLVSAP